MVNFNNIRIDKTNTIDFQKINETQIKERIPILEKLKNACQSTFDTIIKKVKEENGRGGKSLEITFKGYKSKEERLALARRLYRRYGIEIHKLKEERGFILPSLECKNLSGSLFYKESYSLNWENSKFFNSKMLFLEENKLIKKNFQIKIGSKEFALNNTFLMARCAALFKII